MRSLIYVPTNRSSPASIRAYAAEAEALDVSGTRAGFALVESNRAPHVAEHAELFRQLRRRSTVPLVHADLSLQERLLDALLDGSTPAAGDRRRIRSLLLPEGVDYSAGPSKAALLACALGVERLHRRDSDTTPQEHGGAPLHPSRLEDRFMGRTVSQVRDEVDGAEGLDDDLPIIGVGTDYQGAGALDRGELARLSPSLLVDHERLENPGATEDELAARVKRKFLSRDQSPYAGDQVEVDSRGRSEMGAFAVTRLFRLLPEMPLGDTLGTDYFVKSLAYRLGLPVLYHSRRVSHSHAGLRDLRQDPEDFFRYALKDARFKLLKRVWRRLNTALVRRFAGTGSPLDRFSAGEYAVCIGEALRATPRQELLDLVRKLAELYGRAATLAADAGEEEGRFRALQDHLRNEGEALVDIVTAGFRDFAHLVGAWPHLVAAADRLNRERPPWLAGGAV